MKLSHLLYIFLILILSSCSFSPQGPSDAELAKMSRSEKWACLKKGMEKDEVIRILGKPESFQLIGNDTELKYECHTCRVVINNSDGLWVWFSPEFPTSLDSSPSI